MSTAPISTIDVISPRSAQVAQLVTTSGSQVKQGDPICVLDDASLVQKTQLLDLARRLLGEENEKISTARIASQRQTLNQSIAVAKSYQDYADKLNGITSRNNDLGPRAD